MSRRHVVLLLLSSSLAGAGILPAQGAPARVDHAAHRSFTIRDFRTESGVTLPSATVVYGTYGRLNAARDNVVLLPSHYMGNHHGYEWLIGPGMALDTTKLFLVATELFGNGASSSPSNTPKPLDGPRFPVTTIRDNVTAVHRLLTEQLQVTHVRAIIGFSMGAQQAFQWAVSHPTFADRIVATAGTAKTYGHGIVRLEGQIDALTADPAFNGGDYTTPPTKGLAAFGMVWAGWLYSQEWWRRELWRTAAPAGTTFEQYMHGFRRRFSADANNYILQAHTWAQHDVGTTPGFDGDVEKALRSIRVPLLYMPSATDLYFPLADAQYEAAFIPRVTLLPIPSLWGHPAGAGASPADKAFLNRNIARFLAGEPTDAASPPSTSAQAQQQPAERQTFVLVHGAWGGGWDWRAVDSALTSRGHRVHRVTLTGLGDRVHLATAGIGLQTHIDDVVNTIRFESLRDVTLVGHSYGGMVITGAADQATDRIRRVVYVDAFLPDSGESVASLAGAGFNQMVAASARNGLIVPAWVKADDSAPKDVPHPLKTMTDTLRLTNPASRRIAGHYILTMAPGAATDDFSPSADRAIRRGFTMDTLRTDHTPERSAIPALVQLLSGRR